MQWGTGWLGWTERQTLDTSIPTIELAFEGLQDKLRLMQTGGMGTGVPDAPPSGAEVMSVFRRAASPPPGMN